MACTHMPSILGSALESALELADSSTYETVDILPPDV